MASQQVSKIEVWGTLPPQEIAKFFSMEGTGEEKATVPVRGIVESVVAQFGDYKFKTFKWCPREGVTLSCLGSCSPSHQACPFYRVDTQEGTWVFSLYGGFYSPPTVDICLTPEEGYRGDRFWAMHLGLVPWYGVHTACPTCGGRITQDQYSSRQTVLVTAGARLPEYGPFPVDIHRHRECPPREWEALGDRVEEMVRESLPTEGYSWVTITRGEPGTLAIKVGWREKRSGYLDRVVIVPEGSTPEQIFAAWQS